MKRTATRILLLTNIFVWIVGCSDETITSLADRGTKKDAGTVKDSIVSLDQVGSNDVQGPLSDSSGLSDAIPANDLIPIVLDQSTPIPDKKVIPDNPILLPDQIVIPDKATPIPDQPAPIPDKAAPIPDKATPIPDQPAPIPDKAAPIPDKAAPIPDQTSVVADKGTFNPDYYVHTGLWGDRCKGDSDCDRGLVCMKWDLSFEYGHCTKLCNNPGSACPDYPDSKGLAACLWEFDPGTKYEGKYGCIFLCALSGGRSYRCPSDIACYDEQMPAGSGQKFCIPF